MIRTAATIGWLVLANLSAYANCYVLQNNTDAVQTLRFEYSQPVKGWIHFDK